MYLYVNLCQLNIRAHSPDLILYLLLWSLQVGQSKAYGALAKTHEHIGNIELAIQHLESLLDVAKYVNKETEVGQFLNSGNHVSMVVVVCSLYINHVIIRYCSVNLRIYTGMCPT